MPSLTALPADGLSGRVRVPGDKSISHRAIMFGGLAVGETVIDGLLEGEDVLRTADLLRALGAKVRRDDVTARWHVNGMGVGGFHEPNDIVDMGNAGTGVRLAMGLVATHPFTTVFTGDASLRRRPMSRVTVPLRQMGAEFYGRANGLLPIATVGTAEPLPIQYRLPV
ncbi:MAG: 3-phosphoshikimate 1-carboxyvinyltransferase, partial [Pseudomonadota bacterium]